MSTDNNQVMLNGRLVASMETRATQNGTFIGSFTVAVNRDRKQKDGSWTSVASFFDCEMYGNAVKNLQTYLYKGKQVSILGHLEQDRWEKDGQKFSRVKVKVDNLQLMGSKPGVKEEVTYEAPKEEAAAEKNWAEDGDSFDVF